MRHCSKHKLIISSEATFVLSGKTIYSVFLVLALNDGYPMSINTCWQNQIKWILKEIPDVIKNEYAKQAH